MVGSLTPWCNLVDNRTPWSTMVGRLTPWSTMVGRLTPWSTMVGRLTPWSTMVSRLTPWSTMVSRLTPWSTMVSRLTPWSTMVGSGRPDLPGSQCSPVCPQYRHNIHSGQPSICSQDRPRWPTMVHHGPPWPTMAYHGSPRPTMAYHGPPWPTVVRHSTSRYPGPCPPAPKEPPPRCRLLLVLTYAVHLNSSIRNHSPKFVQIGRKTYM